MYLLLNMPRAGLDILFIIFHGKVKKNNIANKVVAHSYAYVNKKIFGQFLLII